MAAEPPSHLTTDAKRRPSPRIVLKPVDLHNPEEYEEMLRQRIDCGWNMTREHVTRWRDKMDSKLKSLFWILLPDLGDKNVGHVSLDSDEGYDPPDLSVAKPDRSLLTIQTFYIAPEHRRGGLGSAVMDMMEDWATKEPWGSPKCMAICLHTLDRRYHYEEEWGDIWPRLLDCEMPAPIQEDWYSKRGYKVYKHEPKYLEKLKDGSPVKLVASFMRKDLQS